MITLPFHFDTARTWRSIARLAIGLLVLFPTLAIGAALMHQLIAAAQLALVSAAFWYLCRRASTVPMGAVGAITRTEVVAQPVTVFGISLRVPNGTFPIGDFQQIRIHERLSDTGAGGLRAIARVFLVGHGTTPDIEIVSDDRDGAVAAARTLGALLGLECVTTGALAVVRFGSRAT